jgi:hypothetical protein
MGRDLNCASAGGAAALDCFITMARLQAELG